MFCKFCGKASGENDICPECSKKIDDYMNAESKNENVQQSFDGIKEETVQEVTEEVYYQPYNANSNTENNVIQAENSVIQEDDSNNNYFCKTRNIAIVGSILYFICCFLPMFVLITGESVSLVNISPWLLVIPVFMFGNAGVDRKIYEELNLKIFPFKLEVLWGVIGLCAIFIAEIYFDMTLKIPVVNYTWADSIAMISSVALIVAPFMVRQYDGSEIEPIKPMDYLWIIPVGIIGLLIFFRWSVVTGDVDTSDYNRSAYSESYSTTESESIDDNSDVYNDNANISDNTDFYDVSENVGSDDEVEEDSEAPLSPYDEQFYQGKLREVVDACAMQYGVCDINSDGIDDLIVLAESDSMGYDTYNVYIYNFAGEVYDENKFNYVGDISSMGDVYCFGDNAVAGMEKVNDTTNWFWYEYNSGGLMNNQMEYQDYILGKYADESFYTDVEEISEQEFNEYMDILNAGRVSLYSSTDYTGINNASFNY